MGIRRFKYIFFVCVLLCTQNFVFAQNDAIKVSTKTEKIDGKKFYLHTVSKGETLIAIAKAYNLNKNDIVLENPEVMDGLKENTVLRIPFQEPAKNKTATTVSDNQKYTTHKVESGKTPYSPSKIYNVKIDDITNLNPELKDGLKKGQVIKIPSKSNVSATSVTAVSTPVKKEPSPIQNNTPVPAPKVETQIKEYSKPLVQETPVINQTEQQAPKSFVAGEPINIALLLPFCTSVNAVNDSVATNKFNAKTAIPLDFYQGAMIAFDSLKLKGLNSTLYVFDTANDSLQTEIIMNKAEIKNVQLIIGPLYEKELQVASNYARKLEVPLVSPFSQSTKVLLSNANGSKVVASSQTQTEALVKYALSAYKGQRFILVHNDSPKDKLLIEVYKKRFALYKSVGDTLIDANILKNPIASMEKYFSKTQQNIILAPISDPSVVSEVFNKLITNVKEHAFTVFGLESWANFDNIEADWLNRLNVHLPSPYYLDYSAENVKRFITKYREVYKTEPNKYAFQGADIVHYYLNNINALKDSNGLNIPYQKGYQTGFNFYKTAVESGWENRNVFIITYKDYKPQLVK